MSAVITPTVSTDNALIKIVQSSGLELTKSQKLMEMFMPYFQRMGEIEHKIDAINAESPSKEDVGIAREIRLALRNNRTASEKVKDEAKASIVVEGRLIDNLNNVVKNTSKLLESKCEAVEKHAEIQEKKRQEDLFAQRWPELKVYLPTDASPTMFPLGTMDEQQYQDMLSGYRLVYEQKLEATRKAEEERLARQKAEAEERARIKAENDRLRAEAEAREKQLAEERAKAAAEKLAAETKAAQEQAELRAEAAKQKAIDDLQVKREREAREKAEAELKAKEQEAQKKLATEAEAKRQAEAAAEAERKARAEAERKAALAPTKDKLLLWVSQASIPPKPEVTDELFAYVANEIADKFLAFKTWAQEQIKQVNS